MKRLVCLSVITLAFGLGLIACGEPRTEGERRAEQEKGIKSSGKMSDSDLEKTIKAKLDNDEGLKAADLKVNANADKNEVTLSGTVQSEAQRAKAVELAKGTQPGLTINDKIDVKPGEAARG